MDQVVERVFGRQARIVLLGTLYLELIQQRIYLQQMLREPHTTGFIQ